jgi:hypothetical protein
MPSKREPIDDMIDAHVWTRGHEARDIRLEPQITTGSESMPQQSLLRIVKRWKRYVPRKNLSEIPPMTRGFYVLYREQAGGHYEVSYIG